MSERRGRPTCAVAAHDEDHGGTATIARNAVGSVCVCACGVVTLSLQYISLRLEPDAFGDLQALVNQARQRLEGHGAQGHGRADSSPLH